MSIRVVSGRNWINSAGKKLILFYSAAQLLFNITFNYFFLFDVKTLSKETLQGLYKYWRVAFDNIFTPISLQSISEVCKILWIHICHKWGVFKKKRNKYRKTNKISKKILSFVFWETRITHKLKRISIINQYTCTTCICESPRNVLTLMYFILLKPRYL